MLEFVWISCLCGVCFHGGGGVHAWLRQLRAAGRMTDARAHWHHSLLLRSSAPLVHWGALHWRRLAWGRRCDAWGNRLVRWPYPHTPMFLELVLHGLVWGVIGAGTLWSVQAAPWGVCLGGLAGASLPWQAWRELWRRWQREMEQAVPLFLELLSVTVDAGLEFPVATQRVAAALPAGPLRLLLQRWQSDLSLGVPHDAAWQQLAARAHLSILAQFVAVLLQSLRLGTPAGDVLTGYVRQLHDARLLAAERQGIIASQKILLPILCCMVPAYFLLTFGGLIVVMWQQGWDGVMQLFL